MPLLGASAALALLLASCGGVQGSAAALPTTATYGPFAFMSGCLRRPLSADEANPLRARDLETYDDDPFGNEAYMLFPEVRLRDPNEETFAGYAVGVRDEPEGGMFLVFTYNSSCVHRITVAGRDVSLTREQGAALFGDRLMATDALVAAWRRAEIAACPQRNPDTLDYRTLCQIFVLTPMSGEISTYAGPEVAVPSRVARLGFVVDGARYAVTFFGDRVAVDPL